MKTNSGESAAYWQGWNDAGFWNRKENEYKSGTQLHRDYNRGFKAWFERHNK